MAIKHGSTVCLSCDKKVENGAVNNEQKCANK